MHLTSIGLLRPAGILFLSLSMAACVSVPDEFNPENPLPAAQFDHSEFNNVMAAHVVDGRVDYPAIGQDPQFASYLQQLSRVDPDNLPKPRQLPFWINTYNALAVEGIINGNTPLTLGGKYRFFVGHKNNVGGELLNLYTIEHGIIIPLGEPRVHFAIVCAAQSCPPLRSEAFRADVLDKQLDQQARGFINNPVMNRFDRDNKVAHLSKIFDWFKDDFESQSGRPLLHYIADYIDDPKLAQSLQSQEWEIIYNVYDWHTNGPLPRAAQ